MKPSLVKLQKFFKLEADRGYDNHAVLGGLERILDRWEAEARADSLPDDLIQVVVERLRDYHRLQPASRAEVLDGLWRRIRKAADPQSIVGGDDELRSPPTEPSVPKQGVQDTPKEAEPGPPEQVVDLAPQRTGVTETGEPTQPETSEPSLPVEQAAESEPATSARAEEEPAALNAPVTVLQGIGPRHAKTLERLGLTTLRDMLYYFPRRYDDYSQLKPINRLWYGEEVTIIGTVQNVNVRSLRTKTGREMKLVEAIVGDGTGSLRVTWFNQIYLARRLRRGQHVVLAGKIDQYLGRLTMNSPEMEPLEQQQLSTNRIVPVYPLTEKITQRWLRRLMNQVVSYWAPRVPDPLPESLREAAGLMSLSQALMQVHFPDSWDLLKAARHRLAFDEIFLLQLGVLGEKQAWQGQPARVFQIEDDWLVGQLARLPFRLTQAQQNALTDVRKDLTSGRPMNRLLQGDVGSGKTVIAALATAAIAREGAQSAIMAPTSILAEQHFRSLVNLLAGEVSPSYAAGTADQTVIGEVETGEPEPMNGEDSPPAAPPLQPEEIRLLIGATPEGEKAEIRAGLESGAVKVVVGTHALIEDPVQFQDLQLAIVDEQHRFGVEQRAALRQKGENPHLLVMTATPIPRSLALTVYGDLDLSVIDEMPPGRQPVGTHVLNPTERERAYTLIRKQVAEGRQAFIIYPLVEETEKSDSLAAVEEYERLHGEVFPRLRIGLLHGRMKPEDKEEVMTRFRDSELDVLVSTSVVEVGVDIPNATVMLIEGANRFGLAQLHQFRGRVGRGSERSFCLLIPETANEVENERLLAMAETNDGFVLAERDLEQRGPGEFLGTRQSGFSELQMATLTDVRLIEKARLHAAHLFEQDSQLEHPKHQLLRVALDRFWGGGKGDIS